MGLTDSSAVCEAFDITQFISQYNIVLHNDDITPFEFVVHLLQTIFDKSAEDAEEIAQEVHNYGSAIAATYSCYEFAIDKTNAAIDLVNKHGQTLTVTMEKID